MSAMGGAGRAGPARPAGRVVVVTKRTALEELVERFNTREQARFYLEHMGLGASFEGHQTAHDAYGRALAALKAALPGGVRSAFIERAFVPTYTFGERDLVVTLGPDGLVVNVAKYLRGHPLLAFNPDPARVDGVLVPFDVGQAAPLLPRALRGDVAVASISMAHVELNDGQRLHAVNDLFIGRRTHVSARYQLRRRGRVEDQSSSGVIVSTGAGSTGWLRAVLTGAAGIVGEYAPAADAGLVADAYRFSWESDHLVYAVREPFPSKSSAARDVCGRIEAGEALEIVSQMPQDGVIFGDGIEEDALQFNSGAIARVGLADEKVRLIVPGSVP